MNIAAVNDAPTLAQKLGDGELLQHEYFSYGIPDGIFTDVDAGDVLSYNITQEDGSPLPAGFFFDPTTRTLSGAAENAGIYKLKITATDTGGLSATDIVTIRVKSNIIGNHKNNTLNGTDADDIINGKGGNDRIFGRKGDDTITGGRGDDFLRGGEGDDTYKIDADVDRGTDTITEETNGGIDTIDLSDTTKGIKIDLSATKTQTIADGVKLILPLISLENVMGGQGQDEIRGNSLNNTISGGAGHDRLWGGAGKDSFYFGGCTCKGITNVKDLFGKDDIRDFHVKDDKILLKKDNFAAITSDPGTSIGSNFATVKNDGLAATQSAAIVYSLSSGNLFYNENGVEAGLGSNGGHFATLTGTPQLSAKHFTIV